MDEQRGERESEREMKKELYGPFHRRENFRERKREWNLTGDDEVGGFSCTILECPTSSSLPFLSHRR